jgi:hypothetical protein
MRFFLSICALLLAIGARAGEEHLVRISVQPMIAGERITRGSIELTLATDPEATPRVSALDADSGATVSLPTGTRWLVAPVIEGWWVQREYLVVDARDSFAIRAWPTGHVAGTLKRSNAADKLPASIAIVAAAVPGTPPRSLPPFTIACPVDAHGRFRCEVPSGTHDLALRAAQYVPFYRWSVLIDRNAPRDLGTLLLKKGASLTGWARAAERDVKLDARASLTHLLPAGASGRLVERLQQPVAQGAVAPNGFFQLTGIDAGTYRLRVEQKGLAPATLYPVRVIAGSETVINVPLALERPLHVRLVVTPARENDTDAWTISVSRIADFGIAADGPPVFEGTVADDGIVDIAGQAPGTFAATVRDRAHNPIATTRFNVAAGDPPQTIAVKQIRVTGRVLRGETPLAATVSFGGAFGETHVVATSDDDGKFATRLPRAGKWTVDVDADELHTTIDSTIAVDDDGNGTTTLRLNDNHVRGRVIDEHARSLAGARVTLSGPQTVLTETALDGSFAFAGVAAGAAHLQAEAGSHAQTRRAEALPIDVPANASAGPYELRIGSTRHITGSVTSLRGPVLGAVVDVISPPPTSAPFYSRVTTDVDGAFALDVPASATQATAIAMPAGFALRAFTMPLDGRDVVLNVPERGGTLRIITPEPLTAYTYLHVAQDGQAVPTHDLTTWSASHGSRPAERRLEFLDLAPAVYRACLGRADAKELCVDGTLAPDAVLELALPRD